MKRTAPTCGLCGITEWCHTWCNARTPTPKDEILATTRNGGTIHGQRHPTGHVEFYAGIYYVPPTATKEDQR